MEQFTIGSARSDCADESVKSLAYVDSGEQPVCSGQEFAVAESMAEANQSQIAPKNVIEARYRADVVRSPLLVPTAPERTSRSKTSPTPHLRSHSVLLIGPGELAEDFLRPLMTSLASPLVYLDAANPAFPNTPGGTLIVRNVERLAAARQEQFLEWLDAQSEIARVIATTPRSLFPRVQRGGFSERLYYRLNTVIVELTRR